MKSHSTDAVSNFVAVSFVLENFSKFAVIISIAIEKCDQIMLKIRKKNSLSISKSVLLVCLSKGNIAIKNGEKLVVKADIVFIENGQVSGRGIGKIEFEGKQTGK